MTKEAKLDLPQLRNDLLVARGDHALGDIAEDLGCSPSTLSVLIRDKRMGPEMGARLREWLDRHGYRWTPAGGLSLEAAKAAMQVEIEQVPAREVSLPGSFARWLRTIAEDLDDPNLSQHTKSVRLNSLVQALVDARRTYAEFFEQSDE